MSQDNRKPGNEAGADDAGDSGVEVNGTPVDLGSHNPDPNAHNWLHPEADLGTWDEVFQATEEHSAPVADQDVPGEQETSDAEDSDADPDAPADADPDAPADADPDVPGDQDMSDDPSDPPSPAPVDTGTRQRVIIGSIVVAVLALMGVGIWLLVNMLSGQSEPSTSEPPVPGSTESAAPLPREVKALDFRLGDCFADFDSEASQSMAVACNTGHSAQLVAVHTYAAEDAYPGREALKTKAQDSCKTAKLNTKSNEYTLKFQLVYPSPTSWDKGDRRVDCFVVVDTGNTIMDDLLQR